MLAVLNSLVLALMDLHQVPSVARQRRRFASHPDEALAWVLEFGIALTQGRFTRWGFTQTHLLRCYAVYGGCRSCRKENRLEMLALWIAVLTLLAAVLYVVANALPIITEYWKHKKRKHR